MGEITAPPRVNILIVDDEPANLVALEAVLTPLHQNIVTATSGRDALRQLLHQEFAVILLDVRMGDMDGFETASLIRTRAASQSTPIIFVTAFGEAEENFARAYRVGAADFIFKPFVPDFLRAKVGVFVELHRKQQAISELLGRAQEASRSKSEFLNMAAHELRTPLSVVAGYLSMLSDGTFGEPPGEWNRVLDILNLKSSELNKIVDDLLTSSRLETGTVPASASLLDLRDVARDAVHRAQGRVQMLGAQLECKLPDEPVMVNADSSHLARIMDNLINNALTYTHRQPSVRIAVSEPNHRPAALLTVEDNGIGIPDDMRERIFERFVRLNDPELAPQPGTGLGLYISRELAERNQGRLILASSKLGSGSTFALRLPAMMVVAPAGEATFQPAPAQVTGSEIQSTGS